MEQKQKAYFLPNFGIDSLGFNKCKCAYCGTPASFCLLSFLGCIYLVKLANSLLSQFSSGCHNTLIPEGLHPCKMQNVQFTTF